jgi:hypothetical protein
MAVLEAMVFVLLVESDMNVNKRLLHISRLR